MAPSAPTTAVAGSAAAPTPDSNFSSFLLVPASSFAACEASAMILIARIADPAT